MHKYKTHVRYRKGNRKPPEDIVAFIITKEFENRNGPIIIAVGGPGGSGKTTFCNHLASRLPDSCILHLDDYKTPRAIRKNQGLFGAHPDANRIDLIREHLAKIRNGTDFDKPIYDNVHGTTDTTESFSPTRFTIIDGEISTYRQFRDLIDFSIFIDSHWKTQLSTRITRDIDERGYDHEKAIATFLKSNIREFSAFGGESKKWSDIHLYCRPDYHLVVESLSEELYERYEQALADALTIVDCSDLIVAITTPFSDQLAIDQKMFIEHLEFLARNGVRRILVNGTTGEFFSLTLKERKLLLKLARRYFPGYILFNASSDSLHQTLDEAQYGEDYGADAIVALAPYYFANAPSDGIVAYYNKIAEAVHGHFVIYNFPKHTQNALTPTQLNNISHYAIKDSAADFSLIPQASRYFVGGDRVIADAYEAGADGFVTGHANYAPLFHVAFEQALMSSIAKDIDTMQKKIRSFCEIMGGPDHIAKVKYAISRSLPSYPSHVRLPLMTVTNEQIKVINDNVKIFNSLVKIMIIMSLIRIILLSQGSRIIMFLLFTRDLINSAS